MNIRHYRPGDEEDQAAVYNEAAARFPRFKSATVEEVRRRCRAPDFDPATRLYAEEAGWVVAYATFQNNGRVSYPWCLPGHEKLAEPLFHKVLETMRQRGHRSAFAAYREDWAEVNRFFEAQGFQRAREMINYVVDLGEMPTAPRQPVPKLSLLERQDIPALFHLGRSVIRARTEGELERHIFSNPYFGPESIFVLRDRSGGLPLAVGLLITNATYADPSQVDPQMPCFRLGAFGTEGLTTKRINGLFSFLAPEHAPVQARGLDLLGHAVYQIPHHNLSLLAAQVASDAKHLVEFYDKFFRRQGSFPVYTRELN